MKKKGLVERIRELSPTIAPRRDLWPGIEASISVTREVAPHRARRPMGRLMIAAAALILVVGLAALAVARLVPIGNPRRDSFVAGLLAEVSEAEREYRKARDRLLRGIEEIDDLYGQSLADGLKAQFEAMDMQISKAVALMKARPDDLMAAGAVLALLDSRRQAISFTEALMH
jgi:hypothetical protein